MSEEEGSFGLNLMEKLFGVILLILGGITTYYTLTSADVLDIYTGFFTFLSIILIVLGLVLITAKTEE